MTTDEEIYEKWLLSLELRHRAFITQIGYLRVSDLIEQARQDEAKQIFAELKDGRYMHSHMIDELKKKFVKNGVK